MALDTTDPMAPYRMQYDDQGRPYFQLPGQAKNYVSPVAMGGSLPGPKGGFLHGDPQWNQRTGKVERPINWGNLMSAGVGTTMTAGLINALMAPSLATGVGAIPDLGPVSAASLPGFSTIPATLTSGAGALFPTIKDLGALNPTSIPGLTDEPGMFDPAGNFIGKSTISGESGPGSWVKKLFGKGGSANNAQNMADLASLIGVFSRGQKANRALFGKYAQQYDQNMLEAQRQRDLSEADAIRKSSQTGYLLGGGSQFKPPTISLGGQTRTAPDFGFAPPPVSQAEKGGAQTLQDQLANRLAPGGSYRPVPLSEYAKSGTAEKIGDYGSLGAGALGTLIHLLGGTSRPQPGISISDLMKMASLFGK